MNKLYEACSFYRRRNYEKCINLCTDLLEINPYDESAWTLKMRAMTQRVYVDDLESENLNEEFLDDLVIAKTPRPGTSLRTAATARTARPRSSATGRPLSGISRPGTMRPNSSMDRTKTARLLTSSARTIRIGTAAMLTMKDGPFIQVSRLNLVKYSGKIGIAKSLFEYLFYHEGNVRAAMDLATQALHQQAKNSEWWWRVQLSKCYATLNLLRNAEQELKMSITLHSDDITSFVRLARIFIRLDQPLMAQEVCNNGFEKWPHDVTIITELARLHEVMDQLDISANLYREIVQQDAMNVEAIACIGLQHFYSEQPELAMRYYRRVLQMGVHSAEIYNNLGLCCLYSQQMDITLACFQRALELAIEPEIKAEVWYNLSYVAISSGDVTLAKNCLNICLVQDPSHAMAMNNLGVLEYRSGRHAIGKTYLTTAHSLDNTLVEPEQNLQFILE